MPKLTAHAAARLLLEHTQMKFICTAESVLDTKFHTALMTKFLRQQPLTVSSYKIDAETSGVCGMYVVELLLKV